MRKINALLFGLCLIFTMSCNDDDSTPNAPVINSCVNNKTVALDSEGNFTLPNYTTDGDLDYTSSNNLDFIFF